MVVTSRPITPVKSKSGVEITLQQVVKKFGEKTVLKEISLTIERGEFLVIVGKSGSGKSTLLRLTAGLDQPSSGTIQFDGLSPKEAKTNVRMMYQDSRLLPWKKVIQNVGIGLAGDWETKAAHTLEQVGLSDFKDQWPSNLSGGQQQRVALARALVNNPDLLLFDEPLSALDALTRLDMQNLIEQLWLEKGFTAMLVTHDVQEAVKLGDRIILIEDGVVALDIRNDAKRPRGFDDEQLTKLEKQILARIMQNHE